MESKMHKIDNLLGQKRRDRKKKKDREPKEIREKDNDSSMESIGPLGNLSSEGKDDI